MICAARVICMTASLLLFVTAVREDAQARYSCSRSLYCALRASGIPLLLPARLPAQIGSVAAITVITADRSGYYVGYSTDVHCNGALSCATLHVAGYLRSSLAGSAYGADRRVALPDRSFGFYKPRDCSGSSCVAATLTFARRNVVYEIDAKATPELSTLLDIYRRLRRFDPQAQRFTGAELSATSPSLRHMSTRHQQRWSDR